MEAVQGVFLCMLMWVGSISTQAQTTSTPTCTGDAAREFFSLLQHGLQSSHCCSQLRTEVLRLREELTSLRDNLGQRVTKGTQTNPGRSCREIRQWGHATSGTYWINPDPDVHPFPLKVFCEMELLGGGWLRAFNMMAKPEVARSAKEMYDSIIRNADVREVLSNSTSSAIYTTGLRLQEYTQVVFGWAASSEVPVSHYGIMTKSEGLKGVCYVDGFCGNNGVIGTFRSSVSGNEVAIKTGSDPNYPHVGMGYSGQVITWGYDQNAKQIESASGAFTTHWGNWNADQPCCLVGATADIGEAGSDWRYSILIR